MFLTLALLTLLAIAIYATFIFMISHLPRVFGLESQKAADLPEFDPIFTHYIAFKRRLLTAPRIFS